MTMSHDDKEMVLKHVERAERHLRELREAFEPYDWAEYRAEYFNGFLRSAQFECEQAEKVIDHFQDTTHDR